MTSRTRLAPAARAGHVQAIPPLDALLESWLDLQEQVLGPALTPYVRLQFSIWSSWAGFMGDFWTLCAERGADGPWQPAWIRGGEQLA